MKKRLLSILLAALMVVSLLPMTVFAETSVKVYRPYDLTLTTDSIIFKEDVNASDNVTRWDMFILAGSSGETAPIRVDINEFDAEGFKLYDGYCIKANGASEVSACPGATFKKLDSDTFEITIIPSKINAVKFLGADKPYIWLVVAPCDTNNRLDQSKGTSGHYDVYNSTVCLGRFGSMENFKKVAASATYAITNGSPESAKETNHGYITVDETAAEGDKVEVTVVPNNGYKLKSLVYSPTPKTVADILPEEFPAAETDASGAPATAWKSAMLDQLCYISYDKTKLFFYTDAGIPDKSFGINTDAVVSADEDENYVYKNGTVTVTFFMKGENGTLNSVTFANTANTTWNGTYQESACVAAGTVITMYNGEQKKVEDLEIGDVIRTFDHEKGEVSSSPVCFIWESKNAANAFTLTFEGDINVTVIEAHGFYDCDENRYVFINVGNAKDYIGHHFYNADTDSRLELKNIEIMNNCIDAYAVATSKHLNHLSNGMLSMCDGTFEKIANLFEYDNQMKYDAELMKKDIEDYGLTPPEKVLKYKGFNKADYYDYNLQYLDIALGKGLISYEWIEALSEYCIANNIYDILPVEEAQNGSETKKMRLMFVSAPKKMLISAPNPAAEDSVEIKADTQGKYIFTMPAQNVTVTAEFEEAHTHSFTYTVNDNKITATCTEGCDDGYDTNPLTLTLTAPTSLVYDGNAKAFTFADGEADAWTGAGLELPTIYYYEKKDYPFYMGIDSAPTDAGGDYMVDITVNNKAAQIYFTIDKATPYIKTTPAPNDIEYGKKLSDSTLFGGYVQISSTDSSEVGGLFEWTNPDTVPGIDDSEITEYDVTFTPADTNNYNTVSCKVTVKVNHTHAPVLAEGQAPTESAAGFKDYYECECGKFFEDATGLVLIEDLDAWKAEGGNGYIAPLVHTVTSANGQDATDTEAGYKAYYECKNCGKYYEDATGLIGISDIDAWKAEGGAGYLAPLHGIDENNDHICDYCDRQVSECVDADNDHKCDICGGQVSVCKDENNDHKCDICGGQVSEHKGVLVEGTAATLQSAGYRSYYACECGKFFEDATCKVEITDLDAWKAQGGNGYLAKLEEDPTSPQTGDNSHMTLWVMLLSLSSMGLCACLVLGKKRNKC